MKIYYNNFHSNYSEDEWIVKNLQIPKKGIFVDVGACDAIKRSNTYHFEKNGWEGICIEPDKFYFSQGSDNEGPNNPLPKYRKTSLNAAISDKDGTLEFISRDRKCLSQVKGNESNTENSYTVDCFKLKTVLNKYNINSIDLLDISCRGHDWIVFNSFDHTKYTPKIVITEWNPRGFKQDFRVSDTLLSTGAYDICHKTEVYFVLKHKSIKYK